MRKDMAPPERSCSQRDAPIDLSHSKEIKMPRWYNFGVTSFINFVWLNGGDYFKDPRAMEVEMSTTGAYGVEVWDTAGYLVGKGQRANNNGGWASFDFHEGTSPP